MFRQAFKYNLLLNLRQRTVLFWSLAFPLILSTFFTMAFSNLHAAEAILEPIKLAYVAPARQNPLNNTRAILEGIKRSEGSEEAMFTLIQAEDQEAARQLVLDDEVQAALIDGESPAMMVTKLSVEQVVVKQVLDAVSHTKNTVLSLMRLGAAGEANQAVTQINAADFVMPVPINQSRMDPSIIYYFALIAMTCLGASSAGAATIITVQPDKSTQGARLSVSPASKWLRTAAAGLAGYLVQLLMSLIVLAYMVLVLGKNFGDQSLSVLLIMVLGTLSGFLMGMAVACLMKAGENAIYGAVAGIYLFSSFLAGLMSHDVKRMIERSVPAVGWINPGNVITNALYSLYYYDSLELQYPLSLLGISLVFVLIITLTLRRRYHDSI